MKKDIRIGVNGVGRLGAEHVRHLKEISGAELVGIYDLHEDRGKQIAKEYDTHYFNSYEELLKEVECVDIVVPTSCHYMIAREALLAGCNVFIEKPITAVLSEAEELVSLANKKNCIMQIGHIERFNPAFLSLEDITVVPMFIEAHRLSSFNIRGTDVAVVLDLMIHDLDIILHLIPHEIIRIDANGAAVITDEIDIANARIQFANGSVANVTASRISQKQMRRMRLFQNDRYISIDFGQKKSEIITLTKKGQSSKPENFDWQPLGDVTFKDTVKTINRYSPQSENSDALRMELESFVDAVHSGSRPPVSGEEGTKALKLALDILDIIKKTAK